MCGCTEPYPAARRWIDPTMRGAAVEALAVVAADDGAFAAFTHGEVVVPAARGTSGINAGLSPLPRMRNVRRPRWKPVSARRPHASERAGRSARTARQARRGVIEALGSDRKAPSSPRSMPWPSLAALRSAELPSGVDRRRRRRARSGSRTVDIRRSIVEAASRGPRSSPVESMWGRVAASTVRLNRPTIWKKPTKIVAIGVRGWAV